MNDSRQLFTKLITVTVIYMNGSLSGCRLQRRCDYIKLQRIVLYANPEYHKIKISTTNGDKSDFVLGCANRTYSIPFQFRSDVLPKTLFAHYTSSKRNETWSCHTTMLRLPYRYCHRYWNFTFYSISSQHLLLHISVNLTLSTWKHCKAKAFCCSWNKTLLWRIQKLF